MDRIETFETLNNATVDADQLFAELRKLPVDIVADVLNYIPPEYTRLREMLPAMASDEIQTNWTGSAGYPLLLQSCAFMRAVDGGMQRFEGRPIDGLDVLDYGCGWGRLIRLLYKYTPPERIYGVYPWDKSIDICKEYGIRANLAVSDYLPKTLPFEGKKFDLIYAFSVFTHLSEKAATMALAACRERIKNDGMMVITVRPLSYWDYHVQAQNEVDRELMKPQHKMKGFAFTPHDREKIDGEVTYGDTSISDEYIQRNWTNWRAVGTDTFLQDPFQKMIFLKPI